MSLNTIYVWEPEIFTGKVPAEDASQQVAYKLHQQYRAIPSHGKTLKAWLSLFADKIYDPQYQSYFSEQAQKWIATIQNRFNEEIYAVVELEPLENLEQNDALYRVFYETAYASGIGFYEPNYNVWAVGDLQSPENAVTTMLQSNILEPLQGQQQQLQVSPIQTQDEQVQAETATVLPVQDQPINTKTDHFEIPKDIQQAEQLIRHWLEHKSNAKHLKLDIFNIAHDFISNWGNLEHPELAADTGYRCFLLSQEQAGVFYQLKMIIRKLTTAPMLSFAMDFTDRFIPDHLQGQLSERLIFRLRALDVRKKSTGKGGTELSFNLSGKWDNQTHIKDFLNNLDAYIDFIFLHLGQGKIETLQAWAYGDLPPELVIDLDFRFEMMMFALSLDNEQLEKCYQKHKQQLLQNKARAHDLGLLEEHYKFCQKLMKIVENEGTAYYLILKIKA